MSRTNTVLLTIMAIVALSAVQAIATEYRIRDLGLIGTSMYGTSATGINSAGYVAGYGSFANSSVWTPDGSRIDIPMPAGTNDTNSKAINDLGYVVGQASYTSGGWGKAWVWDGENTTTISVLPGYTYNQADDINNSGAVVGLSLDAGDWHHALAYKWSSGADPIALSPLEGFAGSAASAINDAGVVVGASAPEGRGDWQACMWDTDGTVKRIGPSTALYSYAADINNAGQVALYAELTPGSIQAFYWSEGSGLIAMGDLEGGPTYCNALNSTGQAVGQSQVGTFGEQAFVWSIDTGMVALPLLGDYCYSSAMAINDSGLIVGYSSAGIGKGPYHAVVWEPVPEPSSMLVLLFGTAGLIRAAFRSKK